jgi:hypothetical protein
MNQCSSKRVAGQHSHGLLSSTLDCWVVLRTFGEYPEFLLVHCIFINLNGIHQGSIRFGLDMSHLGQFQNAFFFSFIPALLASALPFPLPEPQYATPMPRAPKLSLQEIRAELAAHGK